jgi:hypothetical protein
MTWQLSNLSATLDIAEDDAGITQVRDHIVLEVFEQQAAGAFAPDTRDESSSVTFYVGGTSITLNPLGSGKFYCVADNLVPAAQSGAVMLDLVTRAQTWEYYGPWGAAPDGWNQ